MINAETFARNEVLRRKLSMSIDIIDIAFHAADNEEDKRVLVNQENVLTNALAHAERNGILRYKATIRKMAQVPEDAPSPLMDNLLGLDPYEQIAIDAEREHKEKIEKNKTI